MNKKKILLLVLLVMAITQSTVFASKYSDLNFGEEAKRLDVEQVLKWVYKKLSELWRLIFWFIDACLDFFRSIIDSLVKTIKAALKLPKETDVTKLSESCLGYLSLITVKKLPRLLERIEQIEKSDREG